MIDYIVKFNPFYSEKIWGWEKWNVSTHRSGSSVIANGKHSGMKISDFLKIPIIVKIINAEQKLSVQVHPNAYDAKRFNDGDSGKNECWFITDVRGNAEIILGLKENVHKNKFEEMVSKDDIISALNFVEVKSNDLVYIPTGTVHCIDAGIKLIEVQESSDITYRLFDWGRKRETQIEKSFDVINYKSNQEVKSLSDGDVFCTDEFAVEMIHVESLIVEEAISECLTYTVVSGSVRFINQDNGSDQVELLVDESVLIPKGITFNIEGNGTLLKAYI